MKESNAILFSEQEKIFKERTGKDFTSLYLKYYPKLIHFTSKLCKDPQKAEDISTDSFMVAFEKIEKYDKEKSQFSTWLFTIAKNIALQNIKIDKKTMSLDVFFDEEGTTMKDFLQDDMNENDNSIHDVSDMKADVMLNSIKKLKEPYRSVIEMREIQKMSYKDIASRFLKNKENGKVYLKTEDSLCPIGHKEVLKSFMDSDFDEISLSTIKSQIRNARIILKNETKNQFHLIDEQFS